MDHISNSGGGGSDKDTTSSGLNISKANGRTIRLQSSRERILHRSGEVAHVGDSCHNKKRFILGQQPHPDLSPPFTSGTQVSDHHSVFTEEAWGSEDGERTSGACNPQCGPSPPSPPTYQSLAQMSISPYRHKRTTSLKKPHKTALDNMEADEMRPRTSSLPTRNNIRRPNLQYLSPPHFASCRDDQEEFYTLRSFVTTSKGVLINRGDSLRSRSTNSVLSSGSGSITELTQLSLNSSQGSLSQGSGGNSGDPDSPATNVPYRVLMLGSPGVGKSSLTEQFSTSEYLGTFGASVDSYREKSISLLIDGEQSSVNVIDPMDDMGAIDDTADGFLVLFAIDHRSTFSHATDLLYDLRKVRAVDRAVILVANKCDLVRSREVSTEEAKSVAATYDCKYIETSAVLNHNVDELLVGVVTQMRLVSASRGRKGRHGHLDDGGCYSRSKQLLSKLFRKYPISKSCENLYVL